MRRAGRIGVIAVTVAALIALGSGSVALADEGDEAVFADDTYNGFRDLNGTADATYWTIRIHGAGAYLASWERDEGTWRSPEKALAQINAAAVCHRQVFEDALDAVGSIDEFQELPFVVTTEHDDGDSSMSFAPGSDQRIRQDACTRGRSWTWRRTPSSAPNRDDVRTVRIPLTVLGPGVHRVFVVPVTQSDERQTHEFADGSTATYGVGAHTGGEPMWVTVAVPKPRSKHFPFTAEVADDEIAHPSSLSAAPAVSSETASLRADAIVRGASGAAVAVILVGIPTLLRSRRQRSGGGVVSRQAAPPEQTRRDRGVIDD